MEIACTLRHPRRKIIDQLVPKWTRTGGPPSGRVEDKCSDVTLKHQELLFVWLASGPER